MKNRPPSNLAPRDRGLWPRDQSVQHETIPVTIELGKAEWDWLAAALGSPDELGHSELWNVEGVMENAIRYMRDSPTYLASLALELKKMAGDELDEEDRALARFLRKDNLTPYPGPDGEPF